MELNNLYKRGIAIEIVKKEAQNLLTEYADRIETHKNQIRSNLFETAREEAGIEILDIVIWDQGSIDIEFGKMMS